MHPRAGLEQRIQSSCTGRHLAAARVLSCGVVISGLRAGSVQALEVRRPQAQTLAAVRHDAPSARAVHVPLQEAAQLPVELWPRQHPFDTHALAGEVGGKPAWNGGGGAAASHVRGTRLAVRASGHALRHSSLRRVVETLGNDRSRSTTPGSIRTGAAARGDLWLSPLVGRCRGTISDVAPQIGWPQAQARAIVHHDAPPPLRLIVGKQAPVSPVHVRTSLQILHHHPCPCCKALLCALS
mmetsp:Transcript_44849/g.134041  ORF Transcript_44849/g.134041 Transcript_44849/m.134041 type:complete len:240 (-) Transcript_44849:265-984(-)